MKILSPSIALPILALFVTACGSPAGSAGPDPKVESARMNSAVEMRKLFDKAGGDYSKLDATDRAAFDKFAGGASESEKTWNTMKSGPDRATSSGPTP